MVFTRRNSGRAQGVHVPVITVTHPLVKHKLGLLRKRDIPVSQFRAVANEICRLLTYEATTDLPTESAVVEGWAGPVTVERISGKVITVAPILRAGLGMLDGVLDLIPGAKVSIIGMFRDEETLSPVKYYAKLANNLESRAALVLDPMLATGGSMIEAIRLLKEAGCRDIRALCLVAAPEGIERLQAAHPDARVYTAAVDERLNEHGYILPGLGDAGDRLFGTK